MQRKTMMRQSFYPMHIQVLKYVFSGSFFCAVLLLIHIPEGTGDIYVYRDNQGILHFSNTPTTSSYKIFLRTNHPELRRKRSSRKYDHFIKKAAKNYGISYSLLKSMIKVESDFDPRAVSKKGAKGLMQIMPENYQSLSIRDPFDPWQNIRGGTRYFKSLLERYDGNLDLALAAYNAGPNMVDKYRSIPPIDETKNYVKKVMKYYQTFKN